MEALPVLKTTEIVLSQCNYTKRHHGLHWLTNMHFTALFFSDYSAAFPYMTFDISDSAVFGTQLHGGFAGASFNLTLSPLQAYELFDTILANKVQIADRYFRVVYEGEVSNVSSDGYDFSVSCVGFYARSATIIDDRIYPSSPTTVKTVIEDACGLIDSWNYQPAYIEDANYDLITTDPETGADLALDFTDKKVQDAIESVLSYGYSETDTSPPFIAIWEDRTPHLFVKKKLADVRPDWILTKDNLDGANPTQTINLDNVFNSVYAIYANEGDGQSKTTAATDAFSIAKFGTREGVVQNGSNPEGLAMGEALRDYAIEEYAWPIPAVSLNATGLTKSWGGETDYLYSIRAGDIVFMDTGDPGSMLYPQSPDSTLARTRLYVLRTSYTANSNTLSITVGNSDTDFLVLMSRLGLSGGLK